MLPHDEDCKYILNAIFSEHSFGRRMGRSFPRECSLKVAFFYLHDITCSVVYYLSAMHKRNYGCY